MDMQQRMSKEDVNVLLYSTLLQKSLFKSSILVSEKGNPHIF